MVIFYILIQYIRPPFIRNIRLVKFCILWISVVKLAYILKIFCRIYCLDPNFAYCSGRLI